MVTIIRLNRGADNENVEASIVNLSNKHVEDFDNIWMELLRLHQQDDKFWDLELKLLMVSRQDYEGYAVEYNDQTEGILILETQLHGSQITRGKRQVLCLLHSYRTVESRNNSTSAKASRYWYGITFICSKSKFRVRLFRSSWAAFFARSAKSFMTIGECSIWVQTQIMRISYTLNTGCGNNNIMKRMSLNMSKQEEISYAVSNPMDLLFDDNYLKKAVASEALVGGNIGAGLDWGSATSPLLLDLPLLGRLTTLRVSLNRVSRLIIETWNLGVGTQFALRTARACIKAKLISPPPEVIPHLQAVLQQDDLYGEEFISNREVLQSLLKILLTDADWEKIAIATGNSVRQQVLSQVNMDEKVSV